MYYEEKFENGYLCYRSSPDDEWIVIPPRIAHERLQQKDARIAELEGLLREAEGLLCDPQGGRASNELAEKILRSL